MLKCFTPVSLQSEYYEVPSKLWSLYYHGCHGNKVPEWVVHSTSIPRDNKITFLAAKMKFS